MDPEDARRDLEDARRSYNSSVEPPLPRWAPLTCAVLVTAALCVVGSSPSPGWAKAVAIVVGVLLALAAAGVVFRSRARHGIVGLRGPARQNWNTIVVACLAIVVCAFASSPEIRPIYVIAGLAAGSYTWWALRKQVRT
jgi:hypothetical protein